MFADDEFECSQIFASCTIFDLEWCLTFMIFLQSQFAGLNEKLGNAETCLSKEAEASARHAQEAEKLRGQMEELRNRVQDLRYSAMHVACVEPFSPNAVFAAGIFITNIDSTSLITVRRLSSCRARKKT